MTQSSQTLLPSVGNDIIAEAFRDRQLGEFRSLSDFASCLLPLLDSLDWQGNPRDIAVSLPHFADSLDLDALLNVMANLGYSSESFSISLRDLDGRIAPCLVVSASQGAMVLLEEADDRWKVFHGTKKQEVWIEPIREAAQVFVFSKLANQAAEDSNRIPWLFNLLARFKGLFVWAFLLTALTNVLMLATPAFVITVYDQVAATRSVETLSFLGSGIAIAMVADMLFRTLRGRIIAHVGARLDRLVNAAVLAKIISLPSASTENAALATQLSRLKEFEGIREIFTGPLALSFIEVPFALLFTILIAFFAPTIALVPITLMVLYAIIAVILVPIIKRRSAELGVLRGKRQNFLVECTTQLRMLKVLGVESIWQRRFSEINADAAYAQYRVARITDLTSSIAQALMMFAGVGTVALGAILVMNGDLSIGFLIASMILIWRVLAPIQTIFLALPKLGRILGSIGQINRLMTMKTENAEARALSSGQRIYGHIRFDMVSLRYRPEDPPALVGVSFAVSPGEFVAVCGGNGSGKTTVLKLICGLNNPQAGSVMIDRVDIRQYKPEDLRRDIAYVPQVCHLFKGTISQNLRLADPTATDKDIIRAANLAGVHDDIMALSQGYNTQIGDNLSDQLPTGLRQRIALARAYLREAPIVLLDEPANSLDDKGDQAFIRAVQHLRERSTVVLVTHRPSHFKLADRLIVLDQGRLRFSGKPEEVMEKMPKDFL